MVISPDLINQFTKEDSRPKVDGLADYMKPMSGGYDLLTMEGAEWKFWRSIFNPGFTPRDVMQYIGGLVEIIDVFKDILMERAKDGEMFLLGPMTLNLAMDMAGKAIWNHDFGSQTLENTMAKAVVSQLSWLHFDEFSFDKVNPIREVMQRYNSWKMDRYLSRVFKPLWTSRDPKDKPFATRSVIEKAIETFTESPHNATQRSQFDRALRSQMRFFLLAGYDTTGSTLVYVFHLLSLHPEVLQRVRREHDAVLGVDCEGAAAFISKNPHVLNRIPLTTAVIKETLRLYPPASTVRKGSEGFYLHNREGNDERGGSFPLPPRLPTEGCVIFANHHGLHHNPRYWERPEDFIPGRFLPAMEQEPAIQSHQNAGNPTFHSGAWRPFERGPRLCIGQDLAMAEIKAVLLLTARSFDFRNAYEEYDKKHGPGRINTVNGNRAYQITRGGGAHPSDWYPCRVGLASG